MDSTFGRSFLGESRSEGVSVKPSVLRGRLFLHIIAGPAITALAGIQGWLGGAVHSLTSQSFPRRRESLSSDVTRLIGIHHVVLHTHEDPGSQIA